MEVITSSKGKEQLSFEGYIYSFKRLYKEKITWRCRILGCTSYGTTGINYNNEGEVIVILRDHNHPMDHSQATRQQMINDMKKKIISSRDTPMQVVSDYLIGAEFEELDLIGDQENLCRLLRYYRSQHINPKPYYNETLKLSRKLLETHKDLPFYRFGPENYGNLEENEDFLIFYSDNAIERLSNNLIWCVDGTFKVSPDPYIQLYTISYMVNHHVFPSIYCLMKNRRQETYSNIFSVLTQKGITCSPQVIKSDFEMASIQALRLAYPNARLSGCIFHLNQMLMRKISDLGLKSDYQTKPEVRKFVKALTALTFVKKDKINDTLSLLWNHSEWPQLLSPVYEYFFLNLVGNPDYNIRPRYELEFWNSEIDLDVPRTNNGIEGWHNSLNSSFNNIHTSLPLLLEKLKLQEDYIRRKHILITQCNQIIRRKRTYKEMEERLMNFLNRNRENRFGLAFVFSLYGLLFYI